MSRASAPVLTSLLLLLLLLLPRDSAAATVNKQLQSNSCKTLDKVLLEKYVTRPKRSSSDDDVNATTTPLPSGSNESNWRGLYLLLQDRAEQLCDKTLYLQLEKRFSEELANSDRQDNGATTSTVPQTEFEDQQANNVTPSSTAQKESTRINASTSIANNNDDESSGKFHEEDSALTGHLNQTFDNEVSGNNETSVLTRDNEDESEANEAIHARSKEDFLASVRRDKRPRFDQEDDEIVAKFFEAEEEIIDGTNDPYGADGNGTVDEDDRLVNEFFANEESIGFDDENGNTTSSKYDKFVDDFFANESNTSGDNETVSEEDELVNDFFANESADLSDNASNDNKTVSGEDKLVDDFFANEDFSISDNETVSEDDKLVNSFFANKSADLSDSDNKTVSEEDKIVNDFFSNEGENFSSNGSTSDVVKGHDEFVGDFFANENENGNRRNEASGHQKITLDDNKSNETANEDHLVDDFFESENENLTGNGIEVEGSNRDSNGTTLDDKANNNKTASSEFNLTKSYGEKSTLSPELLVTTFIVEQDNATNPRGSMPHNSTMSLGEIAPTKGLEEFLTEKANCTSEFPNNSTEIPRDFHELISSREVTIANGKNATLAQPYSNETVATANGTEDRSAKYPDTGDRDKAGHTPSGDDLFKETMTTTTSSGDWSGTIASIEFPNEATEPPAVRRRRRDILMTFRDDVVASAGKLRAPEATSSSSSSSSPRLVEKDAWESSDSSSRNPPVRIISVEMNKGGELRRQYRTFLLGLASSGQTQFAENRDSRRSRASTEVEQ